MNSFLELDDCLFKDNPNDIYRGISIYLIGYPKGGVSKYSMGIIKSISDDNYTIKHLCRSNPGSSGCPIFNLKNNRVIGIHKGAEKKGNWNIGLLIKIPLDEFNKMKTAEIKNSDCIEGIQIEIQDNLNLENNQSIKSKIGDEKIYFSDVIKKNNLEGFFAQTQERIFLLTNLGVYNLKGDEIKRRIKIEDLKGITISNNSNQFIIHGNQNEYDYLYIYPDWKGKKLINMLQNIYKSTTGEDLLFCQKNEKDISKFAVLRWERTKNPYLTKIAENELTSIRDYLDSDEKKGKIKGGSFSEHMKIGKK